MSEQLYNLYEALEVRVRALEAHYASTLERLGIAERHEVYMALKLEAITLQEHGRQALREALEDDEEE